MSEQNLSIFNFKIFLIKILIPVCAILLILVLPVTFLLERKIILGANTTGAYKVNRIITENHLNEIPIFGSSRAEGGYIPEILGKNYFNYGLSGTGSDVMLFFLKEECSKKDKKTPIILNFDLNGIKSGKGDVSNYLLNANYPPLRNIFGEEYRFYYAIPILKYYGKYEYYFKNYLNDKMHLTKYTNNGAVIEKNTITPQKFTELVHQRAADTMTFSKVDSLAQAFKDIFSQNPQRNFVVVIAPYHKACFNHFPNISEAKAFLAEWDKMSHVKVFDFSQVNYPDSLFINTSHINYKGAAAFSKALKDSLTNITQP